MNREDEKTCDTPPSCPGSKDKKMIQVSPDTMAALCSLVRFFVSVKDNLRKCLLIVIFSLQLQCYCLVSHSLSQSSQFLMAIQTGNKVLPLLFVIWMVSDNFTIASASVVMLYLVRSVIK